MFKEGAGSITETSLCVVLRCYLRAKEMVFAMIFLGNSRYYYVYVSLEERDTKLMFISELADLLQFNTDRTLRLLKSTNLTLNLTQFH